MTFQNSDDIQSADHNNMIKLTETELVSSAQYDFKENGSKMKMASHKIAFLMARYWSSSRGITLLAASRIHNLVKIQCFNKYQTVATYQSPHFSLCTLRITLKCLHINPRQSIFTKEKKNTVDIDHVY